MVARIVGRTGIGIALLLVLVIVIAACGGTALPSASGSPEKAPKTSSPSSTDQVAVVVTLPVFISMVEAVGGERVTVTSIVPPGADAHTYEPTPRDLQAVSKATVVFANGAGLEEWLKPLIESAGGSKVPVYELIHGIDVQAVEHDHTHETASEDITPEEESHHENASVGAAAEEEHHHVHGGVNPHLWLDPGYAERYAERIAAVLSEHDQAHAAQYRENAEEYKAEVKAFDAWAQQEVAAIPEQRRKLVTFHDAYPHFAEHYGLDVIGVVVKSPGQEPGPAEVARLVDEIRAQGVPTIFAEPQFNPKLAETLADEAGIKTAILYSDSPAEGHDYLAMMRTNVQNVVEGLR